MYLETADVTTFGEASLVFERGEMLKPASKIPKVCVNGKTITGLKAITEKGRDAGSVSMFFFDRTGKITHIEINEGPLAGKGLLAGSGILFIGPDAVIVKEEAFEVARNMQSRSSIKSLWGNISKTTKKISGGVGEKIREYSEGTKNKMMQIKKKTDSEKKTVKEESGKAKPKSAAAPEEKAPAKKPAKAKKKKSLKKKK